MDGLKMLRWKRVCVRYSCKDECEMEMILAFVAKMGKWIHS